MAQTLKNLPAVQETRIQPLGREYPLEKEMATHSSILAWRIPWTEEPGSVQSMGSQRVRHDWATKQQQFYRINQKGKLTKKKKKNSNGNPLQYSCRENPMDGGAQWAAVCGVAQSRTRLKQLSSSSFLLWGLLEIIIYILWISMYLTPVAQVVFYIYLNSWVDTISEIRKLCWTPVWVHTDELVSWDLRPLDISLLSGKWQWSCLPFRIVLGSRRDDINKAIR